MEGNPEKEGQAMYPFGNWSERLNFWNSLLTKYPMMLIFLLNELFPVLDLEFVFGRAPNRHYLELRTRLKTSLRFRAAYAFEIIFRGLLNVNPAVVTSENRDTMFWKYRNWARQSS